MAKKIDSALKDLTKALKKHAAVAGSRHVSLKQSQRTGAKVRAAANAYVIAIHAKSGLPNPFEDLVDPTLDAATIESLVAERDAIARAVTGPIPIQNAKAL